MAKGKYKKWLEPDNILRMQAWARDGLSDEQLAHNMGITPSTLYEWKKKYPEISESLKKGKEVADIEVENALHELAVSGNVTAIIFWLKNRLPEKWRDKRDVDLGGEVKTSSPYDELSVDELRALAKRCGADETS